MSPRWFQTAHGRVLMLGAGWLALLAILFVAIRLGGGEGDWKLLGYLALWTYASPLIGVVGLALAFIGKVPPEGAGRKLRTASIIVHALIFLLGVGLLWNASRG